MNKSTVVRKKRVRLSDPEKRGLEAFKAAYRAVGMPPTAQEVADRLGNSRVYAYLLMEALTLKGKLLKTRTKSRCFVLPKRTV